MRNSEKKGVSERVFSETPLSLFADIILLSRAVCKT